MIRKNPFLMKLEAAVKGLSLPSESDAPLKTMHLPGSAIVAESAAAVARVADLPANAKTEVMDVAAFFDPLCQDREGQGPEVKKSIAAFRKLRELLEAEVEEIKVYRFGGTKKSVFVVGKRGRDLFGVKGTQVET
ncbi:MAG TPA: nuclease A inhibitor family protein [Planctomycetia bacterium]|nr:nuclease A inhibitor family protein [Planctomycetia bacterium]